MSVYADVDKEDGSADIEGVGVGINVDADAEGAGVDANVDSEGVNVGVYVDVSGLKKNVKKRTKRVRRLARRMARTSLGLAGLTYDASKSIVHNAEDYARRAEARGESLETSLNSRVNEVQSQVTSDTKEQRAKVEKYLNDISEGMGARGKAIEKRLQGKLDSLKISSGTVIDTDQIKIEVEVIEDEPFADYDSLNAQEVIDRLAYLDDAQLEAVSQYESNTKNRVTVLREIEMLQAAREEDTNTEA